MISWADSAAHRTQMAQSREKHSCDAEGHPTHSALEGDGAHPTADVDCIKIVNRITFGLDFCD